MFFTVIHRVIYRLIHRIWRVIHRTKFGMDRLRSLEIIVIIKVKAVDFAPKERWYFLDRDLFLIRC